MHVHINIVISTSAISHSHVLGDWYTGSLSCKGGACIRVAPILEIIRYFEVANYAINCKQYSYIEVLLTQHISCSLTTNQYKLT